MNSLNTSGILNRKEQPFQSSFFEKQLVGKSILVTGAAGSIGKALVSKLIRFPLNSLICFDQSESELHFLQQELEDTQSSNVSFLIGNIRDEIRIDKILGNYKPDIIFHVAAYKHVSMMEGQVYEAILTNVFGTKIISDLAIKHQVKKFVLISTDKAVHPKSIMGASKRIAELYIKVLVEKNSTDFTIARFGNVVYTNGSVIPNFLECIKLKKTIKITDSKAKRYFMTKGEACQLILTAGVYGQSGETLMFDMGDPITILDLVKCLAKIKKLSIPTDIEIEIIGLRDGEKLEEALKFEFEEIESTKFERINSIKSIEMIDENQLNTKISDLKKASKEGNEDIMIEIIQKILPNYKYSRNNIV